MNEKINKYMNSPGLPLIITCAVTGGRKKSENPNLPVTLAEQVQQTYDAFNAGACMVHIHRRSSADNDLMSADPEEYKEVNAAIRAKCPDVIINNTSGGSKIKASDGAVSAPSVTSVSARPEVASLDAFNLVAGETPHKLKSPLAGRDKDTLLTPAESSGVLALMREYGCKPEYMCYGIEDFRYIREFINLGLLHEKEPHWVQLVFTEKTNLSKIESLSEAIKTLPDSCMLGAIAGGITQWGILAAAIALGIHVRIGMEDNMYLSEGEKAVNNAQLVEKIVRIARELGRPIASPVQAREMLGLAPPQ